MNNLGYEAIECAAFFGIMAGWLKTRPDGERDSAVALERSRVLSDRAIEIADRIGQKPETVKARLLMSMEEMKKATGNYDPVNASILLQRHGATCQAAFENPQGRRQYWIDRASEQLRARSK